ncbi:MAG: hypothetical protein Q6L50_09465 [Gloeomargarita sp. GMQP_bins_120]
MFYQRFALQVTALGAMTMVGLTVAPQQTYANPIVVNCSSAGQTCDRSANYNFHSDGSHVEYFMQLRAPASHCSDVKYIVTTSSGQRWETGFLAPGQQAAVELGRGFPRGHHALQISAVGRLGGCNVGRLGSWGVIAGVGSVPQ